MNVVIPTILVMPNQIFVLMPQFANTQDNTKIQSYHLPRVPLTQRNAHQLLPSLGLTLYMEMRRYREHNKYGIAKLFPILMRIGIAK